MGQEESSEQLISHDEFLSLESLSALKSLYRERGFEGDDKSLLRQAQLDWHQAALEEARKVTEKPDKLEPILCQKEGVTYQVHGLIHGLIGGDNREYKDFIDKALIDLEGVLFENGLNLYYRTKSRETVPDFRVLGWIGELVLGFSLILELPRVFVDLFVELFKLRRQSGDFLDFDLRFHGLDPETRRGLELGTLPSRLQIEYEMDQWGRGFFASFKNPFAIVPRSMFMAGFAEGCAQRTGRTEIPIVVGDLHATEICRFLERETSHPVYQQGKKIAQGSRTTRLLGWALFKTRYLVLAALPAVAAITAAMALPALALNALKSP